MSSLILCIKHFRNWLCSCHQAWQSGEPNHRCPLEKAGQWMQKSGGTCMSQKNWNIFIVPWD